MLIEAVADLVSGLSLANSLLSNPLQQEVPYAVNASVDARRFPPNIPGKKGVKEPYQWCYSLIVVIISPISIARADVPISVNRPEAMAMYI